MSELYVPAAFRQTDERVLADFVREHGFGLLITARDGQPRVSHLPFFLEDAGSRWTLHAHVARGNDHWREGDGPALAVFQGPHHYVSPTWYEEAGTVPTWNYVTVHVRGRVTWLDDFDSKRRVLEQTIDFYESGRPTPWRADFDAEYVRDEMRHIVALRFDVESLDGKWKLNQHHPAARRARTIARLREAGSEDALAIAELMEHARRER
ncbi:MAG: FMN-binding negative transcriptional regulator [Planctomycetes bacterium]|nr:FMN-binding negative transcriptional regulator [Planctomycetota bacterium]